MSFPRSRDTGARSILNIASVSCIYRHPSSLVRKMLHAREMSVSDPKAYSVAINCPRAAHRWRCKLVASQCEFLQEQRLMPGLRHNLSKITDFGCKVPNVRKLKNIENR